MTRKLLGIALGLSMIALAPPAYAFLDNTAIILKDKDIEVLEHVRVLKRIVIAPRLERRDFTGAAEAQAFTNQANVLNSDDAVPGTPPGDSEFDPISGQPQDLVGFGWLKEALITGSVNANTGIVGVNQDVGNMVNQANNVAFALTTASAAIAHSQADSDQFNLGNEHRHIEVLPRNPDGSLDLATINDPNFGHLKATITGSVNTNSGIVGVNQNAGSMNNQSNTLALAVAPGGSVALSESDLGQVNAFNEVVEVETVKRDLITGSVNGNTGVVQVNQSTGNMNNQASAVSMSVLTSAVRVNVVGAP
ncbi:MAG: hypothetical protein HYZ11_06065 [Candidatus Tectomicrobia bacterium]|uniref:Uncharacterized protein n=1 Tax=Tectimicrobiota bacterium TaxID=2528274 RepID=A0A932MLG3_UNCTE|nr:hypothetical protein [Candidatus Tectomicrobia bacterium]